MVQTSWRAPYVLHANEEKVTDFEYVNSRGMRRHEIPDRLGRDAIAWSSVRQTRV